LAVPETSIPLEQVSARVKNGYEGPQVAHLRVAEGEQPWPRDSKGRI